MRIVAISDTHGRHAELDLPAGDVLVHAGDGTNVGAPKELADFLEWFATRPHRHKVFIAGNHDRGVERDPATFQRIVPPGVTFLNDTSVVIEGKKLYGSPWTPEFCNWSFMLDRGDAIRAVWDKIPAGTDVLITHGPPYGHGDLVGSDRPPSYDAQAPNRRAVGCLELLLAVKRVRPRVHIFGHIHCGHGLSVSDEVEGTIFANASTCDEGYEPVNPPLVIDL